MLCGGPVFIRILSSTLVALALGVSAAAQSNIFWVLQDLEINGTQIPAGTTVSVLGVIDVDTEVALSGELATFIYNDQYFNVDLKSLAEVPNDTGVRIQNLKAVDDGITASLCSLVTNQAGSRWLNIFDANPKEFIRVFAGSEELTNFVVKQDELDEDFCISGLAHGTAYRVEFLKGLEATNYQGEVRTLNATLLRFGTTPMKTPKIEIEYSKSILPVGETASLPVYTTNITELDVTLSRVDVASLDSMWDAFRQLSRRDRAFANINFADQLVNKTIALEMKPNEVTRTNLNFSSQINTSEPGLYFATFDSDQLQIQSDYRNLPTQWFVVSNVGMELFYGENSTNLYLTTFDTNEPITNAAVRVMAENGRTLAEAMVNERGLATFASADLRGQGRFQPAFVIVDAGVDGFAIYELKNMRSQPEFLNAGRRAMGDENTYLTLDRELYRHGEFVHAFAVLRQENLDARSGHDVVAQLTDTNGTVLLEKKLTSGASGEVSFSFELANNLRFGRHNIVLQNVDETILQRQSFEIQDYVPLTIAPEISVDVETVRPNERFDLTISAQYLSGGAASNLRAEVVSRVTSSPKHQSEIFQNYSFGTGDEYGVSARVSELQLSPEGGANYSLRVTDTLPENQLLSLVVNASVFDIGGRANPTSLAVPIDTHASYIGAKAKFGRFATNDQALAIDVINVDRLGNELPLDGSTYTLERLSYRWDYIYRNNTWDWKRRLVKSEATSFGDITEETLYLPSDIRSGYYRLTLVNSDGFTTQIEFYKGWGSAPRPASEPSELSLAFDGNNELQFDAPFAGRFRILLATTDIVQTIEVPVEKGENSILLGDLPHVEPGLHILGSLTRAVSPGTEHLPQFAIGRTWVPMADESRSPSLKVTALKTVVSEEPISLDIEIDQPTGVAQIFLVDEGIHRLTGYTNTDIQDYFLNERALGIGFQSNYGRLFTQDLVGQITKVGGGGAEGPSNPAVNTPQKSNFFNTVIETSGLIEIENGQVSYDFMPTQVEGQLRAVVMVATPHGFASTTREIVVQDAVSIDVSLPRFVGQGDYCVGQMQLRGNSFEGPVHLNLQVGESATEIETSIAVGDAIDFALPFSFEAPFNNADNANVPVAIELDYGNFATSREFNILTRGHSYPLTEQYTFKLHSPGNAQQENFAPLESEAFDFDLNTTIEVAASISNDPGIGIPQILKALNRYPYGCVEQLSSAVRGLLAIAEYEGPSETLVRRINAGLTKIIDKQNYSGAFGYWARTTTASGIATRLQPYVLDTLIRALPYAQDEEAVRTSIARGLEHLYLARQMEGTTAQMEALGLLATSGYEVTARSRYAIRQELNYLTATFNSIYHVRKALDGLSMAYWLAAQIQDDQLAAAVSDKIEAVIEANSVFATKGWNIIRSGPAAYLSSLSDEYQNQTTQYLVSSTVEAMATRRYRSTYANARLIEILSDQNENLEGQEIQVNGVAQTVGSNGSITLSIADLANGFLIEHDFASDLYLNIEMAGARDTTDALQSGFQIAKFWYDSKGELLPLENGVLRARQGELFTVVIQLMQTQRGGSLRDVLVTDLLPTGFEIEDGELSPPMLNNKPIDFRDFRSPTYQAAMDDRIIAHFEPGVDYEMGMFKYTVRASYEGSGRLPDAHVEAMYSPEYHGRSNVMEFVVR